MEVEQKQELNIDFKERDMILFGKELDWVNGNVPGGETFCGHAAFKGLTLEKLKELRDKHFLDPSNRQNNAPTIAQFIEFMEEHSDMKAHGYAISPGRNDYRVSLEGLEFNGECSTELQLAFVERFRQADALEFTDSRLYCWYD